MGTLDGGPRSRRAFVREAGALATALALGPGALGAALRARGQMRIGIIGSGRQGGVIGLEWAAAGHDILFSSRHPEELDGLVEQGGGRARSGYPEEAATWGEVVLIAVPYGALPQVGRDYGPLMRGKVVIDCGNPREDRDGPMAAEAIRKGTGIVSAEYLPGVRLVRALNSVSFQMVERGVNRDGERIGIPIAGDDAEAVQVVVELVEDIGLDPVVVGGLARARDFDRGTPVYVTGMSARELRRALGLGPASWRPL